MANVKKLNFKNLEKKFSVVILDTEWVIVSHAVSKACSSDIFFESMMNTYTKSPMKVRIIMEKNADLFFSYYKIDKNHLEKMLKKSFLNDREIVNFCWAAAMSYCMSETEVYKYFIEYRCWAAFTGNLYNIHTYNNLPC